MEGREKILNSTEELFIQYGIRSVTMDDVAREACVSKKTLYRYFSNKDDLVSEVAIHHFEKEAKEFENIESESTDALHEILLVSQCLRKHIFRMNPSLLYDMKKYHDRAWHKYLDFKKLTIQERIERNIERGKKEGYFRDELGARVLSILRVESVQLVFNTKIFSHDDFDVPTVQLQILDHFVHGLLTDKGREKYSEYISLKSTNYIR